MFTPTISFVQLTHLTFFFQSELLSVRDGCSVSVRSPSRGAQGFMLPTSFSSILGPSGGPPLHHHHIPVSTDLRYSILLLHIFHICSTKITCDIWLIRGIKTLPSRRLVLGFHLRERSSGSSAETAWRHVSHAGQQSSPSHAGTVSKDPLWTHQCTHRVQRGLFLAGLHFSKAASPANLPRCPQPHSALHGLKPHATEPDIQWHPAGDKARSQGQRSAAEADAPPAQTRRLPFFAALDATHHQQTHQLPWPAATPKASAALPAGLSIPCVRVCLSAPLVQDTETGLWVRVTLHEHTLCIWDTLTPQATDMSSRSVLICLNTRTLVPLRCPDRAHSVCSSTLPRMFLLLYVWFRHCKLILFLSM